MIEQPKPTPAEPWIARPLNRSVVDWQTVEAVCRRVAAGHSLVSLLPEFAPLTDEIWSAWTRAEIAAARAYADARARRAELLFEEMLTISDTPVEGVKTIRKETENGVRTETTVGDMIEHRRLQVDTRKWILSKMDPTRYGDKLEVEHSGTVATLTGSDVRKMLDDCPLLRQLDGPVIDVPQLPATE